mmetsp:Transcript_47861/g.70838  ORF Transcript_47861/g.70838 Transcript_47861/m.70838 type:complete len:244 (+) Transcript_47861:1474-2205(+)
MVSSQCARRRWLFSRFVELSASIFSMASWCFSLMDVMVALTESGKTTESILLRRMKNRIRSDCRSRPAMKSLPLLLSDDAESPSLPWSEDASLPPLPLCLRCCCLPTFSQASSRICFADARSFCLRILGLPRPWSIFSRMLARRASASSWVSDPSWAVPRPLAPLLATRSFAFFARWCSEGEPLAEAFPRCWGLSSRCLSSCSRPSSAAVSASRESTFSPPRWRAMAARSFSERTASSCICVE